MLLINMQALISAFPFLSFRSSMIISLLLFPSHASKVLNSADFHQLAGRYRKILAHRGRQPSDQSHRKEARTRQAID
jgi:hypothetical protein